MSQNSAGGSKQVSAIITHVIDGFIIEESDLPFMKPTAGSSTGASVAGRNVKKFSKHLGFHSKTTSIIEMPNNGGRHSHGGIVRQMENSRDSYKKSEITIFNSTSMDEGHALSSNLTNGSIASNESLIMERASSPWYASNPYTWNCQQVADFITSVGGCERYGYLFLNEEIDGEALFLLREEHLITVLNLKLGPALKIAAKVKKLKVEWANKKLPHVPHVQNELE